MRITRRRTDAQVERLKRLLTTPRAKREALALALYERRMRLERARQSRPGGLLHFVRYFWSILEPNREFKDGWALAAMCQHLEAVTDGRITRLLINVPPGPMRDDSVVETARGGILLKDVRVGDMVLTHKGRYRPVSAVHDQGVLPILKITTNSGRVTHAAPSHPYLTPEGWVDARDLKVGNILAVVNRVEDRPGSSSMTQEEALLLGYLVGDGSVTHGPGFTNGDREVIDDFRRCAGAMGFETAETPRGTHWQVRLNGGAKVRNWLEGHGLLGASSYTKRIPHAIMNGGREALAAFVGAYWTCDGGFDVRPTKTRGSIYRAYGTTVSEGLANDLVYALGLLGIESRLRTKHRKLDTAAQPGGVYKSFSVEVQNEQMTALFADLPGLCSRKRDLARSCRRSFERVLWGDQIISIETEEDAHCMCLTVEEDHSFVCSGIAVKNSMKSLLVNVFWPAWEWSAAGKPDLRYISFSYASHLTERDNERMVDLIKSTRFQDMWGHVFALRSDGKVKPSNSSKGWKFASSVRGVGTGERGDRILLDDPHNIKEGESDVIRDETVRWRREAMANRLNDMVESAIIIIMQRVHGADVAGDILEDETEDYVHLCIPMEYEPDRHCETEIGWSDPRTVEGECFWKERFPPKAVAICKAQGPYAWAGQYQQRPDIRGGGLLKTEYWRSWGEPKYPDFDYILASLDPALTEKQQNDASALTVWGAFRQDNGDVGLMLMWSFNERLELHGPACPKWPGETAADYRQRAKGTWGLVETTADVCRRFDIDRLLIEAKANGHTVAQEMARLHGRDGYAIQLVDPGPLDKTSRVIRIQPMLSNGQVFAPLGVATDTFRTWAQRVIDQCAIFPRGKHDDLVDSTTQALWWLRCNGFAPRSDEIFARQDKAKRHKKTPPPLYPA